VGASKKEKRVKEKKENGKRYPHHGQDIRNISERQMLKRDGPVICVNDEKKDFGMIGKFV
jgi:hypothetical protein